MRINVGPIHPSTHGVLRLVVDVDGDTVKNVEPHVGFLHRGVEKLMETRMYMQSPSYTEKLDYIAPLSWDDLYVAAVEKATGIEVKERAQYARTILLEFQRIASHLLWLGHLCNDSGQAAHQLHVGLQGEGTGSEAAGGRVRKQDVLREP